MSRRRLRKVLTDAGLVPARSQYDGEGFWIIEFIDYWAVCPDHRRDPRPIAAALEAAGVRYEVQNLVMVPKEVAA